jgi:putative flippase GtrA
MSNKFGLLNLYRQFEARFSELNIQIVKFTLIGILAVLVDLGTYFTLLHIIPEKMFVFFSNESVSKTISFLCGLTVTYTFNKYWTWKEKGRSAKRFVRFMVLYGVSLVVNVSVNSSMLYALHKFSWLKFVPFKYFAAFTVATVLSAVMNFLGQKFWVFKPQLKFQEC